MATLDDIISIDQFGRDHWSTLAYIDCVMIDCAGFQVGFDARMRQGRRHYRVMHEECPRPKRVGISTAALVMDLEHSTVLRDGSKVAGHDDWHCVQDLATAGIFTARVEDIQPGETLHLSDFGRALANDLRAHKASGGSWKDFVPSLAALPVGASA
jgi:hypothetical protein